MANEIQTAPSTTLADNDDWEQELNLRELSMKGYDGISLTEWAAGDTDRPQIAAGSVIEIDGAIAKFTNQTAITDEGGIADGWCYVKFVVSGADVTPTLTNTFGTWDTAKQGFYTSGARFAMFAMYRSGAVTKIYTAKHLVNPSTVYDDLENGTLVDKNSSLYAGEKIKYKIYEMIGNGSTSLVFNHDVTNLLTSLRLLNIRMVYYPTVSKTYFRGGEGNAGGDEMIRYEASNTAITTTHSTATSSSFTYRFILAYI